MIPFFPSKKRGDGLVCRFEAEEMPIMRWKTYDSYEDEDEEPVVPWRTFDSYEANDPDEELKPVNKVGDRV